MSLKFGVYLVEQRIITPEQFCGLVKIQQESTRTLASLAISLNYMTMKQVSRILDREQLEGKPFVELAISAGLIDRADADHMMKVQERSGETIRSLAVECGLLSERQSEVLFNHYMRYGARPVKMATARAQPIEEQGSSEIQQIEMPSKGSATPTPKFKQHPLISNEDQKIPVHVHSEKQQLQQSVSRDPIT